MITFLPLSVQNLVERSPGIGVSDNKCYNTYTTKRSGMEPLNSLQNAREELIQQIAFELNPESYRQLQWTKIGEEPSR